jgi:hypothetical protein
MQSRSFISRDFSCERAGTSVQRRLATPRFICGGTTRRFAIFFVNGGYKIVVDMFGRARIETRVALDARKGRGRKARFAYRQDIAVPPDADLETTIRGEIERNADLSARAGIVAALIGLDAEKWIFTRVLLSENEQTDAGACYQILHLAQPLLDRLPYAT